MDAPGSKDVEYDDKVVVKVQAFVRGCLCRARVSKMVQKMIEELLAKKRPVAKKEGSVANIMAGFEAKNKDVNSPVAAKKNAPRRKLAIPATFDEPEGETPPEEPEEKTEEKPVVPPPKEKPLVSPVFKKRVWPPPKSDVEKKYDPVVVKPPPVVKEPEPEPEPEMEPEKEPEPEEKEAEKEPEQKEEPEKAPKEEEAKEKEPEPEPEPEPEEKPVVPPPKEKPLVSPVFKKRVWPPPKSEIEKKYDPVVVKPPPVVKEPESEPEPEEKEPEPESKGEPAEEKEEEKEPEKEPEPITEDPPATEEKSESPEEEKEPEPPAAEVKKSSWIKESNTNYVSAAKKDLEEQNDRMDEEIQQLLKDIQRIGNPEEPSVTFGVLFDDDEVANYYEALVGTLKAAKKKGLIKYDGQFLLKGINDNVVISLV
mmetsp:Transcript_7105/g.17332  ORF Transcript_7105/g.17332 Transcript_7105/m.17332 type:complete len:424 (-) Transcript_7105:2226-3497(-)